MSAHAVLNDRKLTYIDNKWIYDDNKKVADVFDKPIEIKGDYTLDIVTEVIE